MSKKTLNKTNLERLGTPISFLIDWPALDRAARIVLARSDELDGDNYTTMSYAAEALDARHPLAATLLRRAMVEGTAAGCEIHALPPCRAPSGGMPSVGAGDHRLWFSPDA